MKEEVDLVAEALKITDADLAEETPGALDRREGFYLVPDSDIYPGVNDLVKMKEAYRRFMRGGVILDIAADLQVEPRTALKWVDNGMWVKRRKSVEDAALEEEQQNLERFRMERRRETLTRQLESSRVLRDSIDASALNEEHTPAQLKSLAEASKATADVETRALGLNESGMSAVQQNEKAKAEGENRRPLVFVVPGGGLPPAVRREKRIDPEDVTIINNKGEVSCQK